LYALKNRGFCSSSCRQTEKDRKKNTNLASNQKEISLRKKYIQNAGMEVSDTGHSETISETNGTLQGKFSLPRYLLVSKWQFS
jgi:hypothetical protein